MGFPKLYYYLIKLIILLKDIQLQKLNYFPEPYTRSRNKIKVRLDLSNYARKYDFKNATGVDTLEFAKKSDLASLKLDVDELDIDRLNIYQVVYTV